MRKFEPKPLKPGVDIGLKTPNPEGFWITPKTLRDISILLRPCPSSQGGPPWLLMYAPVQNPLRSRICQHRSGVEFKIQDSRFSPSHPRNDQNANRVYQ